MRKKVLLLIITGICLFIAKFLYCNTISTEQVVGKYYIEDPSAVYGAEVPQQQDTLILYNDGTFKSGFYGKGTYKVDTKLGATTLDLTYTYEYGKTGIELQVYKPLFNKVRLALDADWLAYYIML